MSLRTDRITLTYAILSAVHPSLVAFRALPVPFPAELHTLICDHLFTSVANDFLQSLQDSLFSTLSALCEDCKAYNAHVFGPCVMDWPCMHTGAQCLCRTIGLWAADRCVDDCCDAEENPVSSLFRKTDPRLPAYIAKHVRDTLSAYAAIDPRFPYSRYPLARGVDLDSLLSSALEVYNCTIKPLPTTQQVVNNDIILIASRDDPHTTLARLRLTLQLPARPDAVPRPLTCLRAVTYQQSVPDSAPHPHIYPFRHLLVCLALSSAILIASTGMTYISRLIGATGGS